MNDEPRIRKLTTACRQEKVNYRHSYLGLELIDAGVLTSVQLLEETYPQSLQEIMVLPEPQCKCICRAIPA